MTNRRTWVKRVTWGIVAVLIIYTTIHFTERFWMKDAGGLTRAQVEELSIEEQYALLSDRFDVMHELLDEAQRRIHDGAWRVGDYGRMTAGHYSPRPLNGMNSRNSYFLQTSRVWDSPMRDGTPNDLRALEHLFDERKWKYDVDEVHLPGETVHVIAGVTAQGWRVVCRLYPDGKFILEVMSAPFWADALALKIARHNRVADQGPDHALPGQIPEFPAWDSPLRPPSERITLPAAP